MQAKRILSFLDGIKKQNSREWFTEHKEEYNAVRADFEEGISAAIYYVYPNLILP